MRYNLQEIMMYAVIGVEKEIEEVEETIHLLKLEPETEQNLEDLERCERFLADLEERLEYWNELDDWLSPWEEVEEE